LNLGTLTAVFDADTRKFDAGLKGVQTKIGGVTRDLGRATAGTSHFTNTLSPATSGLTGLASSLTLVAGGTVVAVSAIAAAGSAIFKLATFSQQLGGEIFDLSGKINFTAETLSSLKVAAELSGGSLASLSTSLGICDRNIEEAREGGNEMSRVFKALSIDTEDNERALRQAFTALSSLKGGSQQTALAMKLFGRSGKEVLGIIKESNGDVDAYTEKLRAMGLVITSSGAKKADEFGDKLTLLRLKLEAVTRQIGQELVPTVERAADEISGWLNRNAGEINKTASEVGNLVKQIYDLAQQIRSISPLTLQINVIRNLVEGATVPTGQNWFDRSKTLNAPANLPEGLPVLAPFQRRPNANAPTSFSPFANPQGATVPRIDIPGPGRGGGGRGGGGAKAQKDVLEGLKNEVISLNTEFRKLDVELFNSANMAELAAEKEKILSAVMSQLSEKNKMAVSTLKDVDEAIDAAIGKLPAKSQAAAQALREQAIAQFNANEKTRIAGELTKTTENLTKEWRQEIGNVRTGADSYTIAIQGLEKEYRKYGQTLSAATRSELENAAAMQRTLAITRERLTVTAQTRGRFATEDVDRDAINASRPRIATVEEQVIRERMQMIREQMQQLGGDLTNIFSDSIRTGFERGTKAGLAGLAQGLLQIVEDIFLRKLAAGLTDLLSGVALGGGLLGTLLGGGAAAIPVGGTGATRPRTVTPRDVDSQTRSLNNATTQQTQSLSNQIQLTGQQIVQGLTPVQQGFWEGLIGAAIGGAVSGLTSGLTSGRGGSSAPGPGEEGFVAPNVSFNRRASGGPVSAGQAYMVGEREPELFVPQSAGNIYNQAQMGKLGGQVTNNYYIQLPPTPPGSYKSPQSQRQLASQVVAALQGAKR
jgi:hypothetical protein